MKHTSNLATKTVTVEPADSDFLARRAIQAEAKKRQQIRQRRNALLSASDWTQLADSPLDASQKEAWRIYRQFLRDLPGSFTNAADVIWPEKPE